MLQIKEQPLWQLFLDFRESFWQVPRDPLIPEFTLGVPAHSANLRQPPSSKTVAQQAGMVMEGRESQWSVRFELLVVEVRTEVTTGKKTGQKKTPKMKWNTLQDFSYLIKKQMGSILVRESGSW